MITPRNSGSSGPPVSPPQRTLDTAALERVLMRAAELQARAAETPEEITEERLFELAREVGIPGQYLRQALAEERTRVVLPDSTDAATRFAGPLMVYAARTVGGNCNSIISVLETWMQREECLQVKRRYEDRRTWEPRRDLVGNIKRGFNLGGRGYWLTRASEVGATVVQVDEERVLVRLDADLSGLRSNRMLGSIGMAAGGAMTSGVLVVLGAMLPVVVVPALIGAGSAIAIGRGASKVAARVQLALEQTLDMLEQGAPVAQRPRSLAGLLGVRQNG